MVKYILFFWVSLFVFFGSSKAQKNFSIGLPEIKNFTHENYNASPQNWCITQDNLGRIYFGNNSGFMQYSGNTWEMHYLTKHSIARSIEFISNNKIAVGGQGEFGYFTIKNNNWFFKDLSDQVHVNFLEVWKIIVIKDTIYYFIDRNLILYAINDKVYVVKNPSKLSKFRGFKIDNEIYLVDEKKGLAKIVHNKIILLNDLTKIAKYKVYGLLKNKNNKLIAITSTNGIYSQIKKNEWKKVNTGNDNYLKENYPYSAQKLKDGNYIITTLLGGVIFLDSNLKIFQIINSDNGLNANGVYQSFQDNQDDIWLATENGISYLNYASPLRIIDKKQGLRGSIQALVDYKGNIFIGSYSGLYNINLNKKNNYEIRRVNEFSKKYYFISDFLKIKNPRTKKTYLFLSGLRNIIKIDYHLKAQSIYKTYSSDNLLQIKNKPYVLCSKNNGLEIYKFDNQKSTLIKIGKLSNFDFETKNLVQDKNGDIWVELPHNGVAKISILDYEKLVYKIKFFTKNDGLPDMLYNRPFFVDNKLLISTNKGLYSFNNKQHLAPVKLFGLDFEKDSLIIYKIKEFNDQIWFSGNNSFFYFQNKKLHFTPFIPIKVVEGENDMIMKDDSLIWIANHNKLYIYNSKIKENVKINTFPLIDYVQINNKLIHSEFLNHKVKNNVLKVYLNKLEYNQNKFIFKFFIPYYKYTNNIKYSYKLEGYDNNWSKYEKITKVRYTNLKHGKYTFHLKAKNIFNEESKETQLIFTIKKAWYYSYFFIFIYLVLILFLFYLIFKYNSLRLLKKTELLEATVAKRTTEIFQQKEEIQTQAEQLKTQSEILKLSNIELKQLSLVAKHTTNSVVILDEKGDIEWWNTGFTQLFKYKFNKYQGSNFNRIKDKIRPDIIKALKQNKLVEDKKNITYTTKDKIAENEYIWFQTNITPVLNEDGSIFRYVIIDVDITPIKKAEIEIQEQKAEIEKQRDKIILQNKETKSSIEYASKIQQAMFPLDFFLETVLFDKYFILNIPRNIVSGDFYWVSILKGKTYIAVGDCTGHGIPGAFLSLLGISFLNNIIQSYRGESLSPDEVLNRLRERFIIALHQRDEKAESQDGMDISLISLNYNTMTMEYAGANNSVYYFEKGNDELQVLKADKMPIGIHINEYKPFKLTTRTFEKDEQIYLFSDGYKDQFGGQYGKKFMTKRMTKLLKFIHKKPLDLQQKIMSEIFYEWKGNIDQVDDILVFGIRT